MAWFRASALALAAVASLTGGAAAQSIKIVEAGAGVFRMPMYIALYNGYFKEQGLDAQIVQARSGSDAAKMLAGGAAEFVTGPMIDPVNLKKQDFPVSTIALFSSRLNTSLIVATSRKNDIKTAKDLKGHAVGVTGVGSGTWQYLMFILKQAGLGPEDVKIIPLGGDAGVISAGLKSGNVVAMTYGDPFNYQLVEEGAAFFLSDPTDEKVHQSLFPGDIVYNQIYATDALIKSKPEMVQKFSNAIQQALNWANTHTHDEIADVLKKWDGFGPFDKKVVKTMVERSAYGIPKTAVISRQAYDNAMKLLITIDVLKEPIRFETIINNTFAEKAAAAYPPPNK